jgi:RNA polymerase sigma-70 factor (ECF subfamily)
MTPQLVGDASPGSDANCFVTTRWTLVRNARGASPEARQALSELCSACYAPVVAFLRREGRTEDAARELAHEFFAKVLAEESFGEVERCRGRFRSYLLGAVKHFLANRRRDALREKRGAGAEHVPISEGTDTSPGLKIADAAAFPSDTVFDREWALALVERSLSALQAGCERTGRAEQFSVLKPWLTPAGAPDAQTAAAKLGLSEGALKVAIHRLRARFRELVRADIAQTLYDPAELDDEMQHLVRSLAG